MFRTLVASRPARERGGNAAALSLALHVGLIASAVVATSASNALPSPTPQRKPLIFVSDPVPAPRPATAPTKPQPPVPPDAPAVRVPEVPPVSLPSIPTPSIVPSGLPEPGQSLTDPGALRGTAQLPTDSEPTSVGATGDAPFGSDVVEVSARLWPNHPLPQYPELLRASRVEGHVRIRFVVGTNGRVEPGSIEVLEASHPAFAESVRRVLPQLRFTPGRVGGAKVRQLVELPFGFSLRH